MSAGRQPQKRRLALKNETRHWRTRHLTHKQDNVIEVLAAAAIRRNALLSALSGEVLAFVSHEATLVELRSHASLHEPDQQAEFVYFPTQGVLSIASRLRTGRHVEASMVGREGAVGLVEAIGGGEVRARARVQMAGAAIRLSAAACVEALVNAPVFRRRVDLYVEFMVVELRQAVICHALHGLDARLSRWLLECQDRLDGDQALTLTHAFLAVALGAQRTTITERLGALQACGAIKGEKTLSPIQARSPF